MAGMSVVSREAAGRFREADAAALPRHNRRRRPLGCLSAMWANYIPASALAQKLSNGIVPRVTARKSD